MSALCRIYPKCGEPMWTRKTSKRSSVRLHRSQGLRVRKRAAGGRFTGRRWDGALANAVP
jgi:hypothetical protein